MLATLGAAGCSTFGEGLKSLGGVTTVIPNALDRTELVYKPDIQQGNVVSQEQVNELQPGMTKRQVRFLLGTPMLTDVFHADRWDYAYTLGRGSTPSEQRRVTVYFEQDRLVRIAGDMRPQPESEREPPKQEVVVSVPDWVPPKRTLWDKALDLVGLSDD
ncbi:MAG: outer membrane protein assembly factor BamE [Gammaproteobacteria bacterium]|nr:outer membrane protein assembly factor BamE [Gammaproteobacteria bacterium]